MISKQGLIMNGLVNIYTCSIVITLILEQRSLVLRHFTKNNEQCYSFYDDLFVVVIMFTNYFKRCFFNNIFVYGGRNFLLFHNGNYFGDRFLKKMHQTTQQNQACFNVQSDIQSVLEKNFN